MPDSLSVAVAQTAALPGSHEEALALVRTAADEASGAELLVLPELALCGYGDRARIERLAAPLDSPFVGALRSLAAERRLGLVLGWAERDGERIYNAALALGPDGTLRANYRKANLWGPWEQAIFAPGEPLAPLSWEGATLGLLICYDLEFPEAARDQALRGADTLVVLSATGGQYAVVPEALVRARGYENGCHVVFANRVGPDGPFAFLGRSRITGPDGAVLAEGPADRPATFAATLDRRRLRAWRREHDYLGDRKPALYRSS